MSDIDFDELDKAVNSLMNQHDETQSREAAPAVSSRVDSRPAPERGPADQVQSVPDSSQSPAMDRDAVTPIVPRRPTGRFMDVVPSSSSGRPAPSRETPLNDVRPSRHTGSLQPLDTSSVVEKTEEATESFAMSQADLDLLKSDLAQLPMESPFLSDIEVNKRPLGDNTHADLASGQSEAADNLKLGEAESDDKPDQVEDTDKAEEVPILDPIADWQSLQEGKIPTVDSPKESSNPDDPWRSEPVIDTTSELPEYTRPELSAEIVALESRDVNQGSVGEEAATLTQPVKPDTKTDNPKDELVAADKSKQPSDITPQYKSSDVGAPEPSAIFDTASEDPLPLSHPDKKKSGLMVLVWIAGLLVIGVVGGVLVWNFLIK